MRGNWFIASVSFVCFAVLPLAAGEVLVDSAGQIHADAPDFSAAPKAFDTEWNLRHAEGDYQAEHSGPIRFTLSTDRGTPAAASIDGTVTFTASPDNRSVQASYAFIPRRDITLNVLCLSGTLEDSRYLGGTIACDDGKPVRLEGTTQNPVVLSRQAKRLAVADKSGKPAFTLSFPKPVSFLVQDNRRWNGSHLELRILVSTAHALKAGAAQSLDFTYAESGTVALVQDLPFRLAADKDWIPLTVEPEILPGSALDFSAISRTEAPAGKHGRVVARGQNFEFENTPGIPRRFYGVNLCFTANYMTIEEARTLARRLARIGYNAVRIHHYDAILTDGSPDGTTLNPKCLAKLDNLLAACKENGLYVTTDFFVSRRIPWRAIGFDRPGEVPMDVYKALVPINTNAYENLRTFTRQLLNHVNPLTGLRYADEPTLAFIALINEGNAGNFNQGDLWAPAWKAWLADRKARDPAFASVKDYIPANLYDRSDRQVAAFSLFLMETEKSFFDRFSAFVHGELRCRALLTNMSCWMNPACYQIPRQSYDYVDDHFYVDHPQFLEQHWHLPSKCGNRNPLLGPNAGAQTVAFRRLLDKPFTITEYNYAGPGRFRSVGGIATGASAALQNWAGLWRFAWSHSHDLSLNPASAPLGYFDMAGDPLGLAAERASICLFLRRDLAPLPKTYAVVLPEKALTRFDGYSPINQTSFPWLSWYERIGTVVADKAPADAADSGTYPAIYKMKDKDFRALTASKLPPAGNGALAIDSELGTFTLKTPRTCGGFAEQGTIDAGDLRAKLSGTAATVWVSSLTDDPVRTSPRLLVTHLTDVQNTAIRYADRARRILLDWGRLPHLMRNGEAAISIALAPGSYKVYALTTGGKHRREIPSTFEGGRLSFTARIDADPADATFLYEIARQ